MKLRIILMCIMLSLISVPAFAVGTISGNVTDASSQPLSGISVQFYDTFNDSAIPMSGTTDSSGNYSVPNMEAGTYKVIFFGQNASSAPYVQKWYNGASSLATATVVTVTDNAVTSGVNAVMGAVAQPTIDLGSYSTAAAGAVVMIPITLTTGGAAIASTGMDITYDVTKITKVTSYDPADTTRTKTPGPAAVAAGKTIIDSKPAANIYRIGISGNNTDVIGDGVIANIYFTLAADATGPITLASSPSASDPSGTPVAVTGTSGTISFPDLTKPVVTAFTVPSTSPSTVVSVTSFTATDNVAVTGYLITESSTAPAAGDSGWVTPAPNKYIFGSGGAKTLYAWAKDAAGNISQYVSATVNIISVPGAPTIGTVTGGNAQATINFTAPSNTGGSSITGYTVTSTPGGITATGTASPIIVTGLTNGTAYTFKVTATNSAGTGPASAASASVTPATVPDAPIIGTATAGNGEATVSFTASSNGGSQITNYTVTSNPGGKTATGAASPIIVTGLTNGSSYTFTVTTANAIGASAASAASNSVTPQAVAPGAPTSVVTTPGNQQATVAFSAPANDGGSPITLYTVTSSPGGITATGTASPITVTGLTNDTPYTFTVKATNAKGDSPASAASAAVTPAELTPIIGAPSATIVKAGSTVTYTVSYAGAEAVTLAVGNVTLKKTGTANGTVAVSGTGVETRTVTISDITGDGTLAIAIAANTATAGGGAITANPSSDSATFVVDSTNPTLTVNTLADNSKTSNNTLTITGTASDDHGINTVSVNGGAALTVTEGAFNTAVTLMAGENTIAVTATDEAGNQSSNSRVIVYDPTAPAITFAAPTPAAGSYINIDTATFAGTTSEPGTVSVTVNDGNPITVNTTGTNNSFTIDATLALNANTITIVASDTATPPNTATVIRTMIYDNVKPTLSVTDPSEDITTTFGSHLVKGNVADNNSGTVISFSVDGVAVTPAPTLAEDGSFEQSVSLTEGKTYQVTVTATDQANNVSTVQRNIVYRPITIEDALRALKISMGIETFSAAQGDGLLDVGPLVDGKPHADGTVNLSDAVVLLRKTVDLVTW